jgi:hypothetical protein
MASAMLKQERTSTALAAEVNKSFDLDGSCEGARQTPCPIPFGGTHMGRNCDTGLDNRRRDESGEIRRKRGDTLVGTLRREYGHDFASDFRSDAKLDTVLKETDSASLSDYLKRRR